jgi:hypothetical protein
MNSAVIKRGQRWIPLSGLERPRSVRAVHGGIVLWHGRGEVGRMEPLAEFARWIEEARAVEAPGRASFEPEAAR